MRPNDSIELIRAIFGKILRGKSSAKVFTGGAEDNNLQSLRYIRPARRGVDLLHHFDIERINGRAIQNNLEQPFFFFAHDVFGRYPQGSKILPSIHLYGVFSNATESPSPPLMQSVASPSWRLSPARFLSSCSNVVVMRAPVHPMG